MTPVWSERFELLVLQPNCDTAPPRHGCEVVDQNMLRYSYLSYSSLSHSAQLRPGRHAVRCGTHRGTSLKRVYIELYEIHLTDSWARDMEYA